MTDDTNSLEVLGEVGFRALVYRTLIENLGQGVFVLDTKLRYRAINRWLARWLGVRAEDVLGRTVFELHPRLQAERYAADLQLTIRGKRVEREEKQLVGGKPRTLHLVAQPLRDEDGAVLGLLALCRNTFGRDRSEESMPTAERPADVEDLAPSVAHDPRNLARVRQDHTPLLAVAADVQAQVGPRETERAGQLPGPVPRTMRRETLLLVDREPALRTVFQLILQKEGYPVLLAKDRVQALGVLRDSSVPIRLLILEQASAGAAPGCLSDLTTLWPQVRILLVGEEGLVNHRQLPSQVRGLLNKPIRPELLLRAVREILRSEGGTWEEAAADGRQPKSPQEEQGQSMIPLPTPPAEARDLERQVADVVNVAYGLTLDEVGWTWKTARRGGRPNRQ